MFKKFMPREDRFFGYFRDSAELMVEGSKVLKIMVSDLSKNEMHFKTIKDIEHKADDITHKTVALLHKTFITPLDREDIHNLITKLDDVLDLIEAAAQRIYLYSIDKPTTELVALADIVVHAAEKTKIAIDKIENLKKPEEIIALCIEINRIENEGDQALRSGMAKLFRDETDIKTLIKYKEVYELLESVTDKCEDVANIIEGIVLEYA